MKTICKSNMKYVFIGLVATLLFIPIAIAQVAPAGGWETTIGGPFGDYGRSVWQTFDGGYIVVGDTYSYGNGEDDVYLIKINAYGGVSWQKTFGGEGDDYGNFIQQTTDGGYIIAGITASYGAGGRDVYLIKTDAYGNIVWNKTFGGNNNDYGYSVQQTTDGGYIIAGTTFSYGAGGSDVYFIKTNAYGNTE